MKIHLIICSLLLIQGLLADHGIFEQQGFDELYSASIFFPEPFGFSAKHVIIIKYFNIMIGTATKELTKKQNTVMQLFDGVARARNTVSTGKNRIKSNENEHTNAAQPLSSLLKLISDEWERHDKYVMSKNTNQFRDQDVCRYWVLYRNVKKIHETFVKLEQMDKTVVAVGTEHFGIFLELKRCDQLKLIQKSSDVNEKKWLAKFGQDMANGHYFLLEKTLTNFNKVNDKKKLADIFDCNKSSWENELTYRLRKVGLLKCNDFDHQMDFLKTLAKKRVNELMGEKNAELSQQLYDKYPLLTYGIDFYEWHMLLYQQFFDADKVKLSDVKIKMELFAYFHSIQKLFEQKECPENQWLISRIKLSQLFDIISDKINYDKNKKIGEEFEQKIKQMLKILTKLLKISKSQCQAKEAAKQNEDVKMLEKEWQEKPDQQQIWSDVEFGSDASEEFEKDKNIMGPSAGPESSDQNQSEIELEMEPGQSPAGTLKYMSDRKKIDWTDFSYEPELESDQSRSTNGNGSGPKKIDQDIVPEDSIGMMITKCMHRIYALKTVIEQCNGHNIKKNNLEMEMSIMPTAEKNALTKDALINMQKELSQMHVNTMQELTIHREEFCQKINEMSAVELTKRFSVLFPLDKLHMVWPIVRKCRNQKKVTEWIKLSDKQNHGQTTTAYHDTEAALLAKLYVDFFNNNEIFDPTRRTKPNEIYNKIKRMDIFSMAAIWLMNNLVEELIIFAETVFGKMDAKDNTIDELWSEWARALRHMEKAENLEHKFCSIHKMATFTMNILWRCASKTEWLDILAMLHKKRWSELTINSIPTETNYLSSNFECSVEETAKLMAMARAKPNYELIHALTLYRLIRRLNLFKSLFSGTEEHIDSMKSRLFIMLNSANEFGTLEKAFPEQLHIDALCLSHRIELYTDILFQRTSSERAKVAEVRLATTMLYRYFKSWLQVKLNKGQLQVNVTRAALSTVRNKVYPNFDRMEGLCWLMFLMPLIADEDEKNASSGDDTGGGFVLPTEPSVQHCVMSDGKLPEFAPYWTLVHQFHYEWLSAEQQVGIPYGRLFTQMKTDGILTRMKRLLGNTWFELLCTMYPDVCKYTINVFDDHVTLKNLYIHAIFSTTTTDSDLQWLNLKLAADMIVFVHWFDAEAKGAKMCTFWHTKRAQLRQQYDQLFDLSLTDGQALGQAARAFEQQWHELKHFLITHRHSDQELLIRDVTRKLNKRLESEWDRVEKASGGGEKQQHHQRGHNSVISGENREFLNQLHADLLKRLLSPQQRTDNDNDNTDEQKQTDGEAKQNNELRDKIVKQIESGITMVAQIRPLLADFVGENQVDNIFKILGIPTILEGSNDALLLVDTEREENVESNKKSTTKKKKPKKKQLNTEENGGEEADKTATSDKLSQKGVANESEQSDKVSANISGEQLTTDKQPINDDGDGIIKTNRHKKVQKNKSLDDRKSSNYDTFAKTIKVNKLSTKRAKAADKVVENDQNDKISSNISGIKNVTVNIGKTPNDGEENTLFSKLTQKNTDKMTQQHDKMATKVKVRRTKSKNSSDKTGEIEAKNDASKSVKIYKIADVKEDAFLLDHYQMLLTNPNEFSNEKQRYLFELSIYSNEIWHRFLAQRHFANIAIQFWHSKTNFLVEKWTEIENKQIINEKDEQLKMELHEMLSNFSTDYKRNFENFGWKIFGEILYRNWLARTLLSNARLSEEWNKLNKYSQTKAITVIFAAVNENRKSKDGKRKNMLKYMEKWRKTLEQLKLDKSIFDDFVEKKYLIGQMPAYWRAHIEYIQEINCDIMSNFPEALENILNTNGHHTMSKAHEIKVHFNKIRTIVREWSNGQSDLLLGGSMILGAFTMDSDVDTICVSPEHIQAEQFFGTVSCHQKFAEECRNDGSLFCRLCFYSEIHSLQRIQSNWVPLIRLKVVNFHHEIDIVFASIPGEKQIHFNDDDNYDNDGDQWQQNILSKIEEMIEKLGNQIGAVDQETKMQKDDDKNDQSVLINTKEQMLRSLRSLAGFHSNLRLFDMVTDKENFQKLLLTLKLWAKSHYIYNNALGFFNGTSLAILAAKIMLLYPDATVPFLLERFFLTYATWEWPIPVQIAEIRPNSSLNWNSWNEKQNGMGTYSMLKMPVITPGFPESNSTHLMNHQTEKIIKMAINDALKLLHSSAENHKEKWSHLLAQQIKFNKKYAQYFTVTCVASDLNMFDEFCGFVVKRIRAQLEYLNNCTSGDVDFCHVILLNSCPPYITQKHIKISSKIFCKAWLVGVKEKGTEIQGKQRHDGEQLQQNDNNLKKELDEMIVNSYKFSVFGKWRRDDFNLNLAQQKIMKHFVKSNGTENWQQDFVNLESKYVDKLDAADLN